jgi:VWFA-related protein
MARRWPSLFTAVVAVALTASAQQQPPVMPQLGEVMEVSIVNVDVHVTDRNGRRVLDLKPEDFEVFENGKAQELTNFAEYRGNALPARLTSTSLAAGKAILDKPPKRTMVVFIDAFTLPDRQIEPIFASMKRLLRNTVRRGDAIAVTTWRASRLETRLEFTDDIHQLEKTLDQIRYEQTLGARDTGVSLARTIPSPVRSGPNRRITRELEESLYWKRTMGGKAVSSPGREGTDNAVRSAALDAYFDMKQKTKALNATIASLAGAEGKRAILFASRRFSIYPGAEYYYLSGEDEVPPAERANLEGKPLIDSVVSTANASGVTIYPFLPAGLENVTGPDAEEVRLQLGGNASTDPNQDYKILTNETAALANIAVRTGGVMAFGADVAQTLGRVQEDLDSYYSLAYRTPPASADSSRQIVVKTKNPDLVVRSRREYVERGESSRMKDRVLASLFYPDQSASTVNFSVQVGKAEKKGRGEYLVPVTVRIPVSSLTALPQDGKRVGAFSVFVVTAADIGRVGDVTQQTQPFVIEERDNSAAQSKHIAYEVKLLVDPAATRVSVGLLDEVSREHGIRQAKLPRMY